MKSTLVALLLILSTSNLVGCAAVEPKVIVKTDYVVKKIPLQERPKPINLHRVKFYAVTPENIDEFLQKFEEESGSQVFFALSVPDYENMSLNVAELKRFINQQKSLILYYEDSIINIEDGMPQDTEEVVEEGTLSKLKIW